ncbi:MAG: hypothetical protein KJI69_01195 [Patescibacteria group bacterium]|nr:hypothetical protein [Patescibacteria group bacterium]
MDKIDSKKTIKYLNSRAWYRATKVIYVFFALVIFASIIALFSSEDFMVSDIPNSVVICQYGNEKQFLIKDIFNKDEMPTVLPRYFNFENFENTELSESILKSCEIDAVIARNEQKQGFIPHPYRIEEGDKIQLGYMLLALLIALAVFETVRRIFYYVILGVINPKK